MKRTLRASAGLSLAALALLSAGCASITDGTSQTLIFKFDPAETRCVASRDGDGELGAVTRSQSTLLVSKDKDDIILTCKANGFEDKTMRIVSKTQTAGVVGGVFLDLGITDMITGAMWKYPGEVNVVLDRIGAGPAGAPPQAAVAPVAPSVTAPSTQAAPASTPAASTTTTIGQESYQVERMAEVQACNPQPTAKLIGKGPSVESYSITCTSGDVLMVRCEFGACRVLR